MSKEVTYSYYTTPRTGSRSAVWDYFLRSSDGETGKCTLCDAICRTCGSSTHTYIRHLKNMHGIDILALNRRGGEDMPSSVITYADASWIRKSPDVGRCLVCILCGVLVGTKEEPSHFIMSGTEKIVKAKHASTGDAEKKLEIFKTICNSLDVPNRCVRHWDFRSEDLPFCGECNGAVARIYELEVQLQAIKNCLTEESEKIKQAVKQSENSIDCYEDQSLIQERVATFRSFITNKLAKCTAAEGTSGGYRERPTRRSKARKDAESNGSCELVALSDEETGSDAASTSNSMKSSRKRRKNESTSDVEVIISGGRESESDEYEPPNIKYRNKKSAQKKVTTKKVTPKKLTPTSVRKNDSQMTSAIWKEVVTIGEDKYKYRDVEFMYVDRVYVCTTCTSTRAYTKRYGITNHIKAVHLGLKHPHTCPECQKGFFTVSALKCHQDTHNKEKSCICPICGKGVNTIKNLKRHVQLIHGLLLTSTCQVCNSLFKTESDLELHRAVKHGKKTYFCDSCGKGFDEQSSCKEHQKDHEKQKFFKCFYCSANFLQKPNITTHFLEKHGVDTTS